jgi:hypothetical protein
MRSLFLHHPTTCKFTTSYISNSPYLTDNALRSGLSIELRMLGSVCKVNFVIFLLQSTFFRNEIRDVE